MANNIQLKRSSVSGKVPDAGNVLVGEPVVNLADGVVYTKNASGNIIQIGSGTLQALDDVSNSTPQTNEVLAWDGSIWSPATRVATVAGVTSSTISNTQLAAGISLASVPNLTISSDVSVSGPIKQNQSTVNATTSSTALDFNLTGNFLINMSSNTTFSFSNLSTNLGSSGYMFIKQDETGGRSFTFPAQAKTPGGRTFSQVTTGNSLSMVTYYVVDASTVVVNYIADFK